MRRILAGLLMGACVLPVPIMVGCDREVEHKRSVEVKDDGTTVTHDKKVTEGPDGTVKKTEEKTVDR